MAKVIIPTPLRKFTQNQSSFEGNGSTVGATIENLTETYPDIKQHLLDENGKLRNFVRVYIGDEDIKALQNEATEVKEDSVISIVPAIAGGSL
ncbi:molybdopterin synthase sulfur carrier subunit [marine bacterium AO1-C]|nr:molybdopterin synthase sulfur carrier subunit [marine bacterium AO1-C]